MAGTPRNQPNKLNHRSGLILLEELREILKDTIIREVFADIPRLIYGEGVQALQEDLLGGGEGCFVRASDVPYSLDRLSDSDVTRLPLGSVRKEHATMVDSSS